MQQSTPQLEVVFDYVDPGSFLVHLLLERWPDSGPHSGPGPVPDPGPGSGSAPVAWLPLELAPPSAPSLDPRDPAWMALTHAMRSAALDLGISTVLPTIIPRTRKAHELALHAAERGAFAELHRALFRAHFQEGQDLGRVDILVALAASVGLDPAEARTVLGVDRFSGALNDERSDLLAQGTRGVPTLRTPGGARLEGFPETELLARFLAANLAGPAHPVPSPTASTSSTSSIPED